MTFSVNNNILVRCKYFLKKLGFLNNRFFFIKNVGSKSGHLRCLILHTTDAFLYNPGKKSWKHSNHYELIEMVNELSYLGFQVDVLDIAFISFRPKMNYNLFIGLAAGNSGSFFLSLSKTLLRENVKVKIVPLCLGPEPEISNKNGEARYAFLEGRIGATLDRAKFMRLISKPCFEEIAEISDLIWCIGELNSFCHNSYIKFNKQIFPYFPAILTSSKGNSLVKRDRRKFICLAGNGFIIKGVDLLIEVFKLLPDFNLSIYGPDSDDIFFTYYGCDLSDLPNIEYKGFADTNSPSFIREANESCFGIMLSSSEGMCTSLMTLIGEGCLPIFTAETSLVISDDYPFVIRKEIALEEVITECVKMILKCSQSEYEHLEAYRLMCLEWIGQYTGDSYKANLQKSLKLILNG